jgi:hypothetical protein
LAPSTTGAQKAFDPYGEDFEETIVLYEHRRESSGVLWGLHLYVQGYMTVYRLTWSCVGERVNVCVQLSVTDLMTLAIGLCCLRLLRFEAWC